MRLATLLTLIAMPRETREDTEGEAAEGVSKPHSFADTGAIASTMLFFFGGLGIPVYQAGRWLITGEWYALPLWKAAAVLGIDLISLAEAPSWVGVSKILLWFSDLSTTFCLIIVSVLGFWASISAIARSES
jgi:hypothetical protein